ncbi:tripartite tricarboxylate transporter substrate binding protein [soil metagenome]
MHVRRFLLLGWLTAVLAVPAAAQDAAHYPQASVPIRIIVPATAGGTTDIIARLVARHLETAWHVAVVIDNRAGAGGVVGASALVASKPDGQTILFVPSAFGVRSAIDRNLPYDPLKDIAGITLLARAPSFLVVSPASGVTSVAQLIALGKSRPDGLEFGSAGVGSTAHLHGALFAKMAGIEALHVPFRGTPEALNDVIGGRLAYAFAPAPNVLALAKGKQLLVLASSSAAGAKFIPGIPTVAQAGLAGYEGEDWFGALVPAKTPKATREKIATELARIMVLPDVRSALEAAGAEVVTSSPDQMDTMLATYIGKTRKLADEMKITVD